MNYLLLFMLNYATDFLFCNALFARYGVTYVSELVSPFRILIENDFWVTLKGI